MIHRGDCLEVMPTLPAESVDSIVTDPPYGLSFMGKDWDSFKEGDIAMRRNPQMDAVNTGASRQGGRQRACPDYQKRQARDMLAYQEAMNAVFTEALRIAKPGTHLLAFGGTRTFHRLTCAIEDAGWEIRDCIMWVYGSGFPKSHNLSGDWQGWGTALKPAWEPIIVARKPLDGTVAQNVQEYGTGAVNVDGCRIATSELSGKVYRNSGANLTWGGTYGMGEVFGNSIGRWPANLIHDGSDEVVGLFPDSNGSGNARTLNRGTRSDGWGMSDKAGELRDAGSGSAARFFYVAKASKADRDEGNRHPTVKPTALMRYLCRLVTPPGGIVFDPFCGSGSTGKAATLEGFRFIGIEREAEYVEIAKARIAHARGDMPLLEDVS